MVRVELHSVQHRGPIAFVEATPAQVRIGGPRAALIDSSQTLLGLPSGRRVTAQEAPEEWARGLIVQFRSPDLNAQIVQDDASPDEADAASSGRIAYS
jgi:hypothetical protein